MHALPHIPLQPLQSSLFDLYRISVSVLRLDLVHPLVSGNKWFKLKPALAEAKERGCPLLSFGGAWSNHIHALAYAGYMQGIDTIGIIRGEPEYACNAMLTDARRWGMRLTFVDRQTYRQRDSREYQHQLSLTHGGALVVPEGGSTPAAVRAVSEIWSLPALQGQQVDLLLAAVGTGGTLAGLIAGKPAAARVLGVPVLKWGEETEARIRALLADAGFSDPGDWALLKDAHRGGYARLDGELAAMMEWARLRHALPLDPVYTAKLLLAFNRLLLSGQVAAGTHVVLVHTGGLQGVRGQRDRLSALAPAFTGPLVL